MKGDAWKRFPIGTRVRLTEQGRRAWFRPVRVSEGTVHGYSRDGSCVRVHWDGRKSLMPVLADYVESTTQPPSGAARREGDRT